MARLVPKVKPDLHLSKKSKVDFWILLTVMTLLVLGLIFVLSSSYPLADLYMKNPQFEYLGIDTPYYFFYKQLTSVIIGLAGFFVGLFAPVKFVKKFSIIFLVGAILLMLLAVIPGHPFYFPRNGAARWIKVGPLSFQPAEFAKLGVVMYLAGWLSGKGKKVKSFSHGFIPFFLIISSLAAILVLQKDLGTLVLICIIAVAVFFAAGASIVHLGFLGIMVVTVGVIVAMLEPYRLSRIYTWISYWSDPSLMGQNTSIQFQQSMIAIGSGGAFGRGLGQSRQASWLYEAFSDGIFAIISEELGFFLTIGVVGLFFFLGYRGLKLASETKSKYVSLVAVGIVTWIVFQATINIGASTGLLPYKGMPLPFISYGGSSAISLMFASGILINVSKYRSPQKKNALLTSFKPGATYTSRAG
jgi:cell division protein FtsW